MRRGKEGGRGSHSGGCGYGEVDENRGAEDRGMELRILGFDCNKSEQVRKEET